MSLVLIEGFEGITNDNAEVQKLFARKGHSCYAYDMGADTGRLGSGTCLAYPTNRYFRLHIDIASPATMIIGFAVKFAVWPNKNSKLLEVFRIAPSSWRHFALYVTSDGELYVYDAASQFHYTSGSGLQGNTWHYIELKTTIANSGTLEIRVDGTSILSTTADMLNGTVDSIACVAFAGENATTAYWDDIYILDGTGTENNDFLGPCSIVRLDPSLDNSVDFTPSTGTTNYDKVADGSASDDDTTYVESSTLGDCDKYARVHQASRFNDSPTRHNADMTHRQTRECCPLNDECRALLRNSMDELGLSARAHDKILRVARTIADLDDCNRIEAAHLNEAINYRMLDREFWT